MNPLSTPVAPPEAVAAALQRLSRRDFLRAAMATAATAAASPARAQDAPLKTLTPAQAGVFVRLAQVVLPVDGSPLVPWTPSALLRTLDSALLGTLPPHILAGLQGGLAFFDEGPVAHTGRRFTALDDAGATRFVDEWGNAADAPRRGLAMGLKKLVQLAYWADPATWAPLEYEGPMTQRLGLPRLGNAPMPAR